MLALVRKAVAVPLPRLEVWLAVIVILGFGALLLMDAVPALLVLLLEAFLLF